MKVNRNHQRVLYATLVIIAFFLPAHGSVSAFQFMVLALSSVGANGEVSMIDFSVELFPLLLIPVTALLALFKAVSRNPPSSLVLSLPFVSIAFSFVILSFNLSRQLNSNSFLGLLKEMNIGFFIATFASLLLLLSYSRREALNLG